jgi:hypothetical protein
MILLQFGKNMAFNIERSVTSHKNKFCNSVVGFFIPKNILYIVDFVNLKANEEKIMKKYLL